MSVIGCTRPSLADFGRRSSLHRDVGIAGAIHRHLCPDRERSGLRLEHHAFDLVIAQDAARKGVEQKLHARLIEKVERDELEPLWIERHHIARGERRRDRAAYADQTLEERRKHAADHGFARTMIGRQERGRTAALFRGRLRVERHERHDERRGGVAAKKAVALGEDHARAGLHGAERRAQAGRAAADHQHVRIAREHCLARRQLDARRVVRPL